MLRRFSCGAVLLCTAAVLAHPAHAATARVRWRPSTTGPVLGYEIYVRDGGATYRTGPHWSGNPAPGADGALSALVTFTPAVSGSSYFALVAVNGVGDSALSEEFPLGTPNPCRQDHCATKGSCDFSPRADGTACDDDSFCNGTEVCVAGVCAAGATADCPDGVACGATDPGADIQVDRIRLARRQAGVKLAAKGRFTADPSLQPSTTGAVIELHGRDGALLHSAAVAPSAFRVKAAGRRFQFVSPREGSDPLWNGLRRLELHRKDSLWLVTYKAETPALMTAALEPEISWVIRLGTTCAERVAAACDRRAVASICR